TTSRRNKHPRSTTSPWTSSVFGVSRFQTMVMTTKFPLCLTTSSPRTRRNSKRCVNCRVSGKTTRPKEPFTSSFSALL
ncbi:hypothetical protein BGZ47_010753, partial [Haplosporangium gracile]